MVELGICKFMTRMKYEEKNMTDFFDTNESYQTNNTPNSQRITKLDLCWEQY